MCTATSICKALANRPFGKNALFETLPLVDALILATALEAGAEELWTTDAHLTAYEGRMRVVRL